VAGDRTKDERRGHFDQSDTLPASDPPEDGLATRSIPPHERYRLGAELGRGGMGRVVEAFDLQLGRSVALKEVLPRGGASTVRRFEREVQLTARLEHPSIVPIYDAGVTPDGRPFYVMRRVSGRPFDELLARARGLDERLTLLPPLLAAIDAVAHAHRRGVIHRDLKPQNILVGELGETVVIDWGLAKVLGEADPSSGERTSSPGGALETQVGSVFGTPGFMAPEQARGEELGTRGDVYALGATLYQMLAGVPPHQGTSATEVIDKTARQDVRPLAEVAPGAPEELVAIVEQALAFDAAKRYPNAGALAEDVRRFLAGQLVAAHRYTRLQHVARFARRHRAPLGVAALALVAVAVIAVIGVLRVIAERDVADAARASAQAGQRAAEQARDALAERNDALVIAQARALLESNPTEAAATLKALAPRSPREPEARAIAQAAAARGVAWALEGPPQLTAFAEIDPEGRRLLQISRDGTVRVWDLELRRLLRARAYPSGGRALWVAGGRLLVFGARAAPQLLDPAANTAEPLSIDPIAAAAASANGERVVFTTTAGRGAKLLDVARRAVTELDTEHTPDDLAIAPDGSWIALVDRKRGVRVVDPAGKELTRRAGAYARVVAAGHALAVLADDGKVVEYRLGATPAWTELPAPVAPPARVVDLVYRGEELTLVATSGAVLAWNGERVFPRMQVERFTGRLLVAAGGTLLVPSIEGKVYFLNDAVRGTLHVPSVVPRAKFAAAPGGRRLIVAGDGVIVGFDLGAVVPHVLPQPVGMHAAFVDDRTLIATRNLEWYWLDAETGAATAIAQAPRGRVGIVDIDAASGRVLVREDLAAPERLLLFRKGSPEVRVVAEGRSVWGRLVPGDAIVYAVGDGRLFARIGDGEPREVAKLDGVVESAVALGYRRFAAYSSGGELVRGDLERADLERARVPGDARGFVAADQAGRVLIAHGTRLLAWDGAITELAKLDRPLAWLGPYDGGVVMHLPDFEVQALELVPGARPVRVLPPGKAPAQHSADGKLVAGLGPLQRVSVVELPARARWTLPVLFDAGDLLSVSPSARRVLQGTLRHLVIWTLPQAGPELGPWLDELTNATVGGGGGGDGDGDGGGGGVIAWPWQRPGAR
jgi:hypothetical protein